MSNDEEGKSPTVRIVGGLVEELQKSGIGGISLLDEKVCPLCKDERICLKGCPFHSVHRRARFFRNHEAAFREGRLLYLDLLKHSDEQRLNEMIDFLSGLAQAENSCLKKDLLFEFSEMTSGLKRKLKGAGTLRGQGRAKGFTSMFVFFGENFYVYLILKQNPLELLALSDDFIARRMVPEESIHNTVNPSEYNIGLNEALSEGHEIFRGFIEQNMCKID